MKTTSEKKSMEAQALEQRLISTLLRGITSQVTVMIRKYLENIQQDEGDGFPSEILYVLLPIWFVMYTLKAPKITLGFVQSILLDTLFELVDVEDDVLSIVNLLGIYFLYSSLYPDPNDDASNIIGTAQYLAVFRLAQNINGEIQENSLMTLVVILLLYALYYWLGESGNFKRIQDLMGLLGIHMAQNWFLGNIPENSRLPNLLIIIYSTFPFIKLIHLAGDLYNFVLTNLINALSLASIPYWAQACIALQAWVLSWNIQGDGVSLTVAKFTLVRLLQLAFMDALASTVSYKDGFLVYSVMIMALQFFLDVLTNVSSH